MIELSVVIPTYNRAERLRTCLQALARQTQPAETFEVIVVVDGSTDGTREMLAGLSLPYALRVCWQDKTGQASALNRGAAAAAGRYLVFLDDDVIATPALVAVHLQAQRDGEHDRQGIIGIGRLTTQAPARADGFTRYAARIWNGHYDRLGQGKRVPEWRDCYSGNISMPRAAFLESGGVAADLSIRFDVELGFRLGQQGLTFVYLAGAAAEHNDHKDFFALAAETEKQGREAFELCRRHPAMLPVLLGGFGDTTPRALLLRNLLLALNAPASRLAWPSRLADGRPWEGAWYEFLHSYFYWRGVRRTAPDRETWQRVTYRTPILMYHAFGEPGEPASRFILPARKFARQMAWLERMRYRVIGLDEYVACRREHRLPPARSVVLTIDDGFADVQQWAYPILHRHGFPAIVFLVSGQVGSANRWDKQGRLVGRPLLSWPDIEALRRDGLAFGAHTRTHPNLTTIGLEQARDEIGGSKADIEQKLNIPIRLFAYPFGRMNAQAQALAEQAGFDAACSVQWGANSSATPCFALRRIEVAGTDSLLRFALALWVGDDHLPPRIRKE